MAIALRASTSGHSGSPVSSVVVTKPAGTVDGDYILVSLGWMATVNVLSGWTMVRDIGDGWVVMGKIASSEGASWTFTTSGSGRCAWGAIAFSGVDQTTPVNVSGGTLDTSGTSCVAPSITTTLANTMLVASFGVEASATFTPPGSMTEQVDVGGSARSLSLCYEAFSTTGATGTRTATASSAGDRRSALIAINEAAAASTLFHSLMMCYP